MKRKPDGPAPVAQKPERKPFVVFRGVLLHEWCKEKD